jgi:hypothetical protein
VRRQSEDNKILKAQPLTPINDRWESLGLGTVSMIPYFLLLRRRFVSPALTHPIPPDHYGLSATVYLRTWSRDAETDEGSG